MRLIFVLCALLLTVPALGQQEMAWPAVDGAVQPQPNWLISAQPEPHEFVAGSQAGVRHVINARGLDEDPGWNQSALMEALGLQYHRVPIARADDLNREAVEAFDQILTDIGDDPAMMHCASGNRVGALFALRAAWLKGEDTESAIEIGKAHGLTGLEPQVRQLLINPTEG